jgi:ribosome-associated heat shock protein Hsp15
VKSRTLAQSLIETGYIRVDGKRIEKTGAQVDVGSTIALPLQDKVRVFRVVALPARRGPTREAQLCYEEVPD